MFTRFCGSGCLTRFSAVLPLPWPPFCLFSWPAWPLEVIWQEKKADRGPSKSALLMLYGKLEIGIGIYALILPILIAGIEPVYRFIYDPLLKHFWCYQAAAFIGCLVLLILPTSLMGATLPVLCRFYVTRMSHLGSRTGRLYALNTIGAALGTVLCGFILIKNLGVMKTLFIAAGINGLIGLSCILIARYIPLTATWNVEPSNPLKPPPCALAWEKDQAGKRGRNSGQTLGTCHICRIRFFRHGL